MTDTKYNGWTNYETWCVKLWLDNERGTYLEVTEHASEVYAEATEEAGAPLDTSFSNTAYELAEWLKEYITGEDNAPDLGASVYGDLLNAAFSEVNWLEMATSYLDDAKETYVPEDH